MGFYDAIRVGASGAADTAFTVDRSLRFNDGDSPYLSRTPSSAGNRRTYTISVWSKINDNGSFRTILGAGGGSTRDRLQIFDDDRIVFNLREGLDGMLKTNRLARDPSAWYHFVVGVDTTQATASNRLKLYVNGIEETSFETATYPSQDYDCRLNNNIETFIGQASSSNFYFDGYLAEFNFIDGSALTPSSFAETDALTGEYKPKKYTGGYGTNGFYLNFSDNSGTTATTLGKDSSGNGNNFTPNNFSVAAGAGNDSVEDTPTNNFPTLNPLFLNATEAAGTFSEGNLKLVTTGSEYGTALSTFSIRYGKYYWEVKQLGGSFATHGIVRGTTPNADVFIGYDPNGKLFGFGYNQGGTIKGASGTGTTSNANLASSLATFTTNDIIGFASDISNGTLAIYKNNTLIYTITGINDNDWIPAVSGYTSNGSYSINFGQQAFSYTPPTGYKKLNSANLPDPTILLPNKHFDTLLYSGTGSSNAITGLNFAPNWTWIKSRSLSSTHKLIDSVRGDGLTLASNNTNAEASDSSIFSSLDSSGFTVTGTANSTNASSATYVAWNWNAGETDGKTYTVTVVDSGGNKYRFDGFAANAVTLDLAEGGTYIFNYPSAHPFKFSTTADGTHGGGSEYTTGVTHNSSTQVTIVVAASAPTLYYYCSSHSGMGGQVNTNSTLGSSNFDGSVQSTVKVNATAGFSIIKYAGSGQPRTIGHGLGVVPDVVITKSRDSSDNWLVWHQNISTSNLGNYALFLNSTGGPDDASQNWYDTVPTSTVFTRGNYSSGDNMIAYCFSEVAGYSKFGKYTGNGSSDGTFVFTGFRPAFVLFKRTDTTAYWEIRDNKRDSFNTSTKGLFPGTNDAEISSGENIDFLSNGFKLRHTQSSTNANSGTYIYLAFAESPFKNARAR